MAKNCAYILSALVVGIFCGWLSRQVEEIVREEVRYIERPTTTIEYKMPEPIKVGRIDLPRLQYIDTIRLVEHIPADTASIVADYLERREYALDFSNDTLGVFKVDAVVEANRLTSAMATIRPLQREVLTEVRDVRKFRPYIGGGVGIGSRMSASVEVGALLKERHLVRVGYQRVGNDNYLTLGYGITFGNRLQSQKMRYIRSKK